MLKKKKKKEIKEGMDKTQIYKIKRKHKELSPKAKKIIKISIICAIIAFIIMAGVVFGIVYGIAKESKLSMADLAIKNQNSVVKDINGNIIATLSGDENRSIISINNMAQYLPKAFVAIEDERFYEHNGVDLKRTSAAIATYVLNAGNSSFGGSTITQQVVKNLTNDDERSWKRKVKEWTRAYYIEQELSKDQILELYLNLVFLGGNAYGVEVGSMYYFNKSASQLDLAQCAFLAGVNNSPNMYDAFSTEPDAINKIKERTKTVLNKMHELGKINSEEEYNQAIAQVDAGLVFTKGTIKQSIYSYHTEAAITEVINELQEKNDWTYEYAKLYLFSSGLTIYTTENPTIQATMEEEFKQPKYQIKSQKTKDADGNYVTTQAAMVLIDHKTGYVLATVGKLGEKTDSFGLNRATQSTRQTGSSMKPLAVLAPAIDKGVITAATVLDDVPSRFGGFSPRDYGNIYRGLVTVRYAIQDSQNTPMVKAMQLLGPENSIKFLKSVGITSLDDTKDNGLSLALGGLTNGISPLEMAAAYAAIANDGVYIEPTFYTKVVDSNNNTILETKQETRTVMSAAAAYVVKEILTQPVKAGTASAASISGISVAAKTGTTNDNYDKWLCGFTPYYAAATWFGYDTNETINSGISSAIQIFSNVMRKSHSGLAGKTFSETRPSGVVTATVCRDSGLIPTEACKNDPRGDRSYTEYFVKGTVPSKSCETHVSVDICKDTGLLATEFCPNKETKVFITRPNWETDTAWQVSTDAEFMLTIKDFCTIHTAAPDTTKPVITLNGNSTITLALNETYTEQGATATDDKDGNITDKIVITGSVNKAVEGTYTITYTVKDSSNNETTATRTVTVKDTNNNSINIINTTNVLNNINTTINGI